MILNTAKGTRANEGKTRAFTLSLVYELYLRVTVFFIRRAVGSSGTVLPGHLGQVLQVCPRCVVRPLSLPLSLGCCLHFQGRDWPSG